MPKMFFEVERVTTCTRRFVVEVDGEHDDERKGQLAREIVASGLAHQIKGKPGVEQILLLTNNEIDIVQSSEDRESLLP